MGECVCASVWVGGQTRGWGFEEGRSRSGNVHGNGWREHTRGGRAWENAAVNGMGVRLVVKAALDGRVLWVPEGLRFEVSNRLGGGCCVLN